MSLLIIQPLVSAGEDHTCSSVQSYVHFPCSFLDLRRMWHRGFCQVSPQRYGIHFLSSRLAIKLSAERNSNGVACGSLDLLHRFLYQCRAGCRPCLISRYASTFPTGTGECVGRSHAQRRECHRIFSVRFVSL